MCVRVFNFRVTLVMKKRQKDATRKVMMQGLGHDMQQDE